MAPEQAIGGTTDHRADLYALGGTLFHLVTGTVPYETGDVTYQHAHSPVPDPRERVVTVPEALAELIMNSWPRRPRSASRAPGRWGWRCRRTSRPLGRLHGDQFRRLAVIHQN